MSPVQLNGGPSRRSIDLFAVFVEFQREGDGAVMLDLSGIEH
jgi:hypothetical protein